jgi:hypothetical protein
VFFSIRRWGLVNDSFIQLEKELTNEELQECMEDLCRSKAEEFVMIGYEHVTAEDIWICVSEKYQKNGMPALHRLVNDILTLKITQFMNWMTMNAYKGTYL